MLASRVAPLFPPGSHGSVTSGSAACDRMLQHQYSCPSAAETAASTAGAGKSVQSIARLEATKGSSVSGTVQFFP